MMFFFTANSTVDAVTQWDLGTAAMILIGTFFVLNCIILVLYNIKKVKFWLRVRKAQKAKL